MKPIAATNDCKQERQCRKSDMDKWKDGSINYAGSNFIQQEYFNNLGKISLESKNLNLKLQ